MDNLVYDELASVEGTHWWFQGRRRILRDVLRRRLRPAGREVPIVDIGCGTGEMVDMLTEFGPVTGLDASAIAVRYCRQRFGDRVDVRLGRVPEDLPASVQCLTAFDVVEHLEDDDGALSAIHDRLAPDGLFVCTVPAFPFLWSRHDEVHHHYRRYTRRSLRRKLETAGFRIERVSYFNTFLFPVAAAVRTLHRLRPAPDKGSDVTTPSRFANRALLHLFASERWLLRATALPFGVSLLAVCTRGESRARAHGSPPETVAAAAG